MYKGGAGRLGGLTRAQQLKGRGPQERPSVLRVLLRQAQLSCVVHLEFDDVQESLKRCVDLLCILRQGNLHAD